MTTIACTPVTMSSDSWAMDDTVCSVRKIFRTSVGIVGCSGVASVGPQFVSWLDGGQRGPIPDMEGSDALLIDGVSIWCFSGSVSPIELLDPFTAIGCGAMAALGAMYAGQTPKQAVKIAAKINPHTGGAIRTLSI